MLGVGATRRGHACSAHWDVQIMNFLGSVHWCHFSILEPHRKINALDPSSWPKATPEAQGRARDCAGTWASTAGMAAASRLQSALGTTVTGQDLRQARIYAAKKKRCHRQSGESGLGDAFRRRDDLSSSRAKPVFSLKNNRFDSQCCESLELSCSEPVSFKNNR